MTELIDKERLKQEMDFRSYIEQDTMWSDGLWIRYSVVEKVIDKQPPICKKGHWIIPKFGEDARCSECGFSFSGVYDLENQDNFCRHCGADMRG